MTYLFVIGIIIVLVILGHFMESKNKAVSGASKGLFVLITMIPAIVFWLLLAGVVIGFIYFTFVD